MSPPEKNLPVKNTFIDFPMARSMSEDMTFLGLKRASCPSELSMQNFLAEMNRRRSTRGSAPSTPLSLPGESGGTAYSEDSLLDKPVVSAQWSHLSDHSPALWNTGPTECHQRTFVPCVQPDVQWDPPSRDLPANWSKTSSGSRRWSVTSGESPAYTGSTGDFPHAYPRLVVNLTPPTWSEASAGGESPVGKKDLVAPESPRKTDEEISNSAEIGEFEERQIIAHDAGKCRPCAFFHRTQGCVNSTSCLFCHLCPARELERRRKEHAEEKYERKHYSREKNARRARQPTVRANAAS
eukprot:GEMP01089170.1.p1 GENE.GEMP01089170.1~~GEMP01089170.1.p1  ORF type:complete len:296 (+),score=66.48 GEMP01089170.1:56-943(+)